VRRRRRFRIVVDGLIIATLGGLAALGLASANGGGSGRLEPAATTRSAAGADAVDREAGRLYYEVSRSLSPLLAHIRILPQLLDQLAQGPAQPSVDAEALTTRIAEDAATARDLVSRLQPLDRPEGPAILSLYESAAMLDTEAARAGTRAAGLHGAAAAEAARSARRLFLLGDRVFDSARRLHNLRDGLFREELIFPLEVPEFTKEGLHPDVIAPPTEGRSGFAEPTRPALPDGEWLREAGDQLTAVRVILDGVGPSYGRPPWGSSFVHSARRLEASALELGALRPADPLAQEGAVNLRLALLVQAESLRGLAGGEDQTRITQANRLRLLGERLWRTGAELLDSAGLPASERLSVRPAPLDAGLLRQGGVFGGRPPALRPGDDVDAGVPGGVPQVDFNQVFPQP
jgi:hypothetical protein